MRKFSGIGARPRQLVVALAVCAAATGAAAQDSPDASANSVPVAATSGLSLAQSLKRVWDTHPQVRQARLALKASGIDIWAERTGYLPYAQIDRSIGRDELSSGSVRVVQPLWSGGSTLAQVDVAKARQAQARATLAKARLDLGLKTTDAFLAALSAQEQSAIWVRYIAVSRELLESIQRRAVNGAAPQADVRTAVARLQQAQAGAAAAQAVLAANRAQLTSLIGDLPDTFGWPDAGMALGADEIASVATRARQGHPDWLLAQAQRDEQEAQKNGSRARLSPEISLQRRIVPEKLNSTPSFDATDNQTMLVFQYQTTAGMRAIESWRADRQRLDASDARLDSVQREVSAAVEVARADLNAATSLLKVQQEASATATELVTSFLRQYEAGRKTWLEVLNAQREANDAEIQVIGQKKNFWSANTRLALYGLYWDRLLGDLAARAPVDGDDE